MCYRNEKRAKPGILHTTQRKERIKGRKKYFSILILVSFVKRPTNGQGSSGFFISTFQILPRHVSANDCLISYPNGVLQSHK
jgi:hypothetical protein